jgi:hypothetical protein
MYGIFSKIKCLYFPSLGVLSSSIDKYIHQNSGIYQVVNLSVFIKYGMMILPVNFLLEGPGLLLIFEVQNWIDVHCFQRES